MVLPDRIELSTSPLPRECSTTELRQQARGTLNSGPKRRALCHSHPARGKARGPPPRLTSTRVARFNPSTAKREG
jgi:hypothetical protein